MVAVRQSSRRRLHALKTFVGLLALLVVIIVCGVAGFAALSSLSEGERRSDIERYLDGDGVVVESRAGQFRARFPDSERNDTEDTIDIFGGDVEVTGLRADLGEDAELGVSWFDLPTAPAVEEAPGVLAAIVVFVADGIGGAPADGGEVKDSPHPAYEFVVELAGDALSESPPAIVTVRAVLIGRRVYQLKVDSTRRLDAVVAELAASFQPL